MQLLSEESNLRVACLNILKETFLSVNNGRYNFTFTFGNSYEYLTTKTEIWILKTVPCNLIQVTKVKSKFDGE